MKRLFLVGLTASLVLSTKLAMATDFDVVPIPEPATLILLGSSMAGLIGIGILLKK